ncbi:hypothetical protein COY90_00805, partial [Candidatus Roizmanbacteria bacterium CG_4_10_14_0_8_um_filter_39_9]
MKQDLVHDFFEIGSKAIFLIPVILFIIMLFQILGPSKGTPQIHNSPILTPTIVPAQKTLNLQGPFICTSSSKTASWSAYIKDKKIVVISKQNNEVGNYLLDGDCGYMWKTPGLTGQKICGISSYVSIAENLLSTGIISPDSLLNSNLSSLGTSESIGEIKKLIKSCKKSSIPNKIVF